MAKPRYTYDVYENGEYRISGDIHAVAKYTGLSDGGVRYLANKGGNETWRFEKQNIYLDTEDVDVSKIRYLIKRDSYRLKEIGEVLDVHVNTVAAKLRGDKRFRTTEIEELEDLFFLEEGELIVD